MQPMKITYVHYIDYANDKQELFEYKNIDVSSEYKDNNFWLKLIGIIHGKDYD